VSKLSQTEKDYIQLFLRSPDRGDGWCNIAERLWQVLVDQFPHKELIEMDAERRRARLTPDGLVVARYL